MENLIAPPDSNARRILSKVPEITIIFWIAKILTTGMGEVFSDYLCNHINPVIAVAVSGIFLVAILIIQFSARRYIPWIYWLTVIMVSIFGTMAADVLHVGLGIPYIVTTIFYSTVLVAIFFTWYYVERTLSIHSIYTFRREIFYWATVLITFALGTATGDLTASTIKLGYLTSGAFFAFLIAVPAITYRLFKINEIFAFWFAYIMTRPLGASVADWIGLPLSRGGLGLGTGSVSLILTLIIIVIVAHLSIKQRKRIHQQVKI